MQKRKTFLLAVLTTLFMATGTFGQAPLSQKLPVDGKIKIGTLSNGLTYYIRKNSRPEKKVELRLVVNTGSILEDDDQQGLAHFTEHMAFNGTKNFKKNELVSFLQTIGVEFGADLNAYTSFDETVYILPIPTDKKENIEKGFQVLEDWASNLTFENAEIDKERGVVLEESRLGKGANDRINKVLFPKLFEGSKYAQRLPIGKDDILKNFKYDVVKRFYKDWYRPDLMAVLVVGDIDPAEAERLIKKHFEKIKAPAKPRVRTPANIPLRKKSEGIVITDKEATNSILRIYHTFTPSEEDVTLGDYRESIVKGLFTSMLNQRLQELTQKPEPPFIFGNSSIGGFVRGYESYSSFAVIGKPGIEAAVNALIEENERARKFGFTANELERTKMNMLKTMERAYNERDKSESRNIIGEYVRNFLEHEPIPGIEKEYEYYKEFMPGISLEEVNQYTAANIPSVGNRLVVLTAPEKTDYQIPTNEELLSLVEKAEKIKVSAYEEKAIASSLLASIPTAGKIIKEEENKKAGFTELTLSNGVKVILKPTDFKNDQVLMSAFRYGGQFLYDTPDRFNAESAATLVSQMGVGEFSPIDLQKVLAGKTVSVNPRINAATEGLNGQSSASDLESLFQLTYLFMTQPREDKDLFTSYISKQQALYQNLMSEPRAVFQDSLLATLYKHHPRAPKVPKPEDYAKINLSRSLEIYKERFGDASGFTFVFVGAIKLDEIKPLIATYLASLPSEGTPPKYRDIGMRPVSGVVKEKVFSGTEPKSFIIMQFNGETTYSKQDAFALQALIEVMNIKLIETLREELSGIYGGGMYGSINRTPYNNYNIGISLPCGPENVDKLITATLGEIEKAKTKGPSETDLNKVKETWKKQYEENIKTNNYWLEQLQSSVENGTPFEDILTYETRVDALKTADLKAVANKFLDMKNFVQVVLYPQTGN